MHTDYTDHIDPTIQNIDHIEHIDHMSYTYVDLDHTEYVDHLQANNADHIDQVILNRSSRSYCTIHMIIQITQTICVLRTQTLIAQIKSVICLQTIIVCRSYRSYKSTGSHRSYRSYARDHTCYLDTDFDHTDQVCPMYPDYNITDHIDHTIQNMQIRQIMQIIHVMYMDRP